MRLLPRAPHRGGLLAILFIFFTFFVDLSVARSAFLGIDLGTEFIKAVLVKPGVPFEIVETKDSKRKESAALVFKPDSSIPASEQLLPQRFYGSDALSLQARFPASSYSNLKQLLGLPAQDNQVVDNYRSQYPAVKITTIDETKTVGFDGSIIGESSLTLEELLAMELLNVKANGQDLAGDNFVINRAVITIPPFFTVEERRSVLTAAKLAGLEVMSLITDGAAVGIQYATSRTFPNSSQGEKPEYHIVFDIGSGCTSATLLKFESRNVRGSGKLKSAPQQVTVLGTGWDRTLGGDALTAFIVDDMITKFVDTPVAKSAAVTTDAIRASGPAMARLRRDAQKLRQILSANSEASIGTESLISDLDFRYTLSRADFEKMVKSVVPRIGAPVAQALEQAGMSIDQLDSIILHGGVTRTPFVQTTLESIATAAKVKTTVNSDEAAAFGATFRAAQLSPLFRARDIRLVDMSNGVFFLQHDINGEAAIQPLFGPTSSLGEDKNITLPAVDGLSFSLAQELPWGSSQIVHTVRTTDSAHAIKKLTSEASCSADQIFATFKIHLDTDLGLPRPISGSLYCEVTDQGGALGAIKNMLFKKPSANPLPDASGSQVVLDDKPATKTVWAPLQFSVVPKTDIKFSDELFSQAQKRLARLDKSDRRHQEHSDLLNELESYIYKARDLIETETFIRFSTPELIQKIEQTASDVSDWFDQEGALALFGQLKEKYQSLVDLVKPVTDKIAAAEKAKLEAEARAKKKAEMVTNFKSALAQAKEMIDLVHRQVNEAPADGGESTDSKLISYTLEDIAKLESLYTEHSAWFDETSAKGDDEGLSVKAIQDRTMALQRESVDLLEKKMKYFEQFAKKFESKGKGGKGSKGKGDKKGADNQSATSGEPSRGNATPEQEDMKAEL